jgi:hypothetical protein
VPESAHAVARETARMSPSEPRPVAASPSTARMPALDPGPGRQAVVDDAADGPESMTETFERLLSPDEVEARLEWLEAPLVDALGEGGAVLDLSDLEEVRALFAELAVNHVRPVRDFMIDLRWGDATVDWVAICEPALRSLARAADTLELGEVRAALDRFGEGLASAQGDAMRTLGGERRDQLLARYDELSRLMPQAFALELDRTQRESVILRSLLLQVPGVKKITLDKMIAAGLSTLEAMFLATPADMAATTGIALPLAERIVQRFGVYRDQVRATVPDATRAGERERLAELTSRLRREHEEYESVSQSWSLEASDRKRQIRKTRAQTLCEIQVALARLGEVERLARIERLAFDAKVAELEVFLEEAVDKYAANP